jgi:hypothetical protein
VFGVAFRSASVARRTRSITPGWSSRGLSFSCRAEHRRYLSGLLEGIHTEHHAAGGHAASYPRITRTGLRARLTTPSETLPATRRFTVPSPRLPTTIDNSTLCMPLSICKARNLSSVWLINEEQGRGRVHPRQHGAKEVQSLTSAVHRRHTHNVIVRRCSEIRMVTPNSKKHVRDRSSACASVTITYLSSRRPVSACRLPSSHEERFPDGFQWAN